MDPSASPPFVRFGRETCEEPAAARRREWLVTNGLGGYASAALDGTPGRSYSGWLIAALDPPVGRTVLVGAILERATVDGVTRELGSLDRVGGERDPDGGSCIASFELDGMRPAWRYAITTRCARWTGDRSRRRRCRTAWRSPGPASPRGSSCAARGPAPG
jgi:hypothetical protein